MKAARLSLIFLLLSSFCRPVVSVTQAAPAGFRLPLVGLRYITNGPECNNTHQGPSSEAIDFGLPAGTEVYATEGGEVVFSEDGWHEGFGNLIIIRHDNGLVSWYAHLSERFVLLEGQRVAKGSLIAKSGYSGNVRPSGPAGAHLHFEVRRDWSRSNIYSGQSVWIRDLSGITWSSGDPNTQCWPGYDGQAAGPPIGGGPPTLNFTVLLKNVPSGNQSSEVAVVVQRPLTKSVVWGPVIVTTNNDGYYSGLTLSGVQSGVYDVCAKPRYRLGLCARYVSLAPDTTTYLDFSRGGTNPSWLGDVDNYGQDNGVNSLDSSVFIDELHRCYGCSNHPFDLNRDGVLNAHDYSLLRATWQDNPQGEGSFGNPFTHQLQSTGRNANVVPETGDNQPDTSLLLPPMPYPVLVVEPLASSGLPVGHTFNAWVWLDTAGIPTHGVDVLVHYDPGVLEVLDEDPNTPGIQVVMKDLYPSVGQNTVDPSTGLIKISAYDENGAFNGSGKVAEMRFRIIAACHTAVSVIFTTGDSTDSNITEDGTGLDVLADAGISYYTFTGSPYRVMPTINIAPESLSYINDCIVPVTADVDDPYNQVQCVVFQAYYDDEWHGIGVDEEDADGWSIVWDASSITDQRIKIKATAWLPGELHASAENDYICLDRSPPVYNWFMFSPSPPSCDVGAHVLFDAYDEMTSWSVKMWVNTAPDGSDTGQWILVGSYGGIFGLCPTGPIFWKTYSFTPGTHRLIFVLEDSAGNFRVVDEDNASSPITATIGPWFPDLDGDGDVDVVDIMKVVRYWGQRVGVWPACLPRIFDLDSDGTITIADVQMVATFWRTTCSAPTCEGTPLGSEQRVMGRVNETTPAVNYCINTSAGQWASVRMFALPGSSLDTYLKLYDPFGQLVVQNDDGAGIGLNSFLTYQFPQNGYYRLEATRYGSSQGDYALRLEEGREAAVGDINRDCTVNLVDYEILRRSVYDGLVDPGADLNLDGITDEMDIDIWTANYGRTCNGGATEQQKQR